MTNGGNQTASGPKRTVRRVLLWAGSIIFFLLICAVIAGEIVLHRAEPMLKAKVVETLSTRFDSRVQLDRFHVSLFDGLKVSGGGLRLFPQHLQAADPLFAVNQFSFSTTWRQLFQTPMHIESVRVSGLDIHLPPKSQRGNMPHTNSNGHIKISIGELLCDNATLVIGTDKPGKVPLQFDIGQLRLTSIGPGEPMKFHAVLVNPKPIGNIDTTGDFGPFDEESPGDTPVRGQYAFRNADLGTLKGIGGILSSNGKYDGALNRIVVDGETSTPDFRLDIASHPVPLNTTFHAIVDGTNGDTYLQPVDAWLLHSHIVAKGDVVRSSSRPGHDIRLDVTLGPAQIQDILQLGAKAETPLMTGAMQMHTSFHLPPGQVAVMDKLRLAGTFAILNAHFTNDSFQSKVDQLSLRGQGEAKEAKRESKAMKQGDGDGGTEANVASTVRGDFTFGDGKIDLKDLEYLVPGADIGLEGTYTLKAQVFDFHGSAHLDAKISQMFTGWKSLLLKPANRFFSKHGGTEVPIQITGTRSDPHIGLDYRHKDHDKEPGKTVQPSH
jgi:AsmA-like C-terminal region